MPDSDKQQRTNTEKKQNCGSNKMVEKSSKNYETLNLLQPESETDPFTEDRYRLFYKFFPKNSQYVLDIGCNTGRGGVVLKILDRNLKIFGLDVVKSRLDRLPEGVYEKGVYGYSTSIPVDDLTYDVVVAGEFIEHIYSADVDKSLAEMFRVLNIGGRLILTTPNPKDIKRKIRKNSVLGGAHVSQHFHDALKMKLRMMGYSRVKVVGSGRVTRYLGVKAPLFIYGSYMIMGDKI